MYDIISFINDIFKQRYCEDENRVIAWTMNWPTIMWVHGGKIVDYRLISANLAYELWVQPGRD